MRNLVRTGAAAFFLMDLTSTCLSMPKVKSRSMTTSGIVSSLAEVMYSARLEGYQMLRMRPGITGTMAPGEASVRHNFH